MYALAKFCFLCLRTKKQLINLNCRINDQVCEEVKDTVPELVQAISKLEIPVYICFLCHKQFLNFYNFKKKCFHKYKRFEQYIEVLKQNEITNNQRFSELQISADIIEPPRRVPLQSVHTIDLNMNETEDLLSYESSLLLSEETDNGYLLPGDKIKIEDSKVLSESTEQIEELLHEKLDDQNVLLKGETRIENSLALFQLKKEEFEDPEEMEIEDSSQLSEVEKQKQYEKPLLSSQKTNVESLSLKEEIKIEDSSSQKTENEDLLIKDKMEIEESTEPEDQSQIIESLLSSKNTYDEDFLILEVDIENASLPSASTIQEQTEEPILASLKQKETPSEPNEENQQSIKHITTINNNCLHKLIKLNSKNPKKFICTICNESFAAYTYLQTHKKQFHPDKQFKCSVCNEQFNYEVNLKHHLKWYGDAKLCSNRARIHFECSKCKQTYTSYYDLKIHIENIHFENKNLEIKDFCVWTKELCLKF